MAGERSLTLDALVHATDAKGRLAIDVATLANKRIIWKRLFLLGRYEKIKLLHHSPTSRVWQVEDKEAIGEMHKVVALKQFQDEKNFVRECSMRAQFDFSDAFVVEIAKRFPADRIVLMPFGDCSLEDAMSKEHFVGVSPDIIRTTINQLVQGLMHVHSRGVLHGDLKGKNICRFGSSWKLIDFDASVEIGGDAGVKIEPGQTPSNVPPELGRLLLRAKFPAKTIRSKLEDPSLTLAAHRVWTDCLRVVEQLDESGVDPLTCSLRGVTPSFELWALGLILFQLFTASRMFNSDQHDELDEREICKLALWHDVPRVEIRKKVFSKAELGTVPNSEKDSAARLITTCLQPDPTHRPQSVEALLMSDYFHTNEPGRPKAKLLFVSTPGKSFDPRTRDYSFDVMGWLQELCRIYVGQLVVAYDWAGSSSADPRDQRWFDQIFDIRNGDGMTLFDQWKAAPTEEGKERLLDAVEAILYETRWLSAYKGSIKAQIRETCQCGSKAILVRLVGGPITRIEARVMGQLICQARTDLAQLGVANPDIELHAYDDVTSFAENGLPGFLSEIYGDDYTLISAVEPSLLAGLPAREVPSNLLAQLQQGLCARNPVCDRVVAQVVTYPADPGDTADTAAAMQRLRVILLPGSRVLHPERGGGFVAKLDWDDPRGHPVHIQYDNSEVHHYTPASAARKLSTINADGTLSPCQSCGLSVVIDTKLS
jgi:serine/threonine protein kinase